MTTRTEPERSAPARHTPFETWVLEEGLTVSQQQVIPDMRTAELAPWERTGVAATLLDMAPNLPSKAAFLRQQSTSRYLCEIPPGGTYKEERHLYEEVFYVVSGRGAISVWHEGSPKHTFEWQAGSVFSIPLNAWHELYNASGEEPARLYAMFTAPMVFNIYGSREFIFNTNATFPERFDPDDETYFSGRAERVRHRLMKTNFISNVRVLDLDDHGRRGPGTNMHAVLANGHMVCHLSEFPGQTYKKAHTADPSRTRAGLNSEVAYLFLDGEGYDLQWGLDVVPGRGVPFDRIDYREGSLLTPGPGFHQHFNATTEPIRYVVLRFGSLDGGARQEEPREQAEPREVRDERGPRQIEFDEEDPAVWDLFSAELAKRGLKPKMEEYVGKRA